MKSIIVLIAATMVGFAYTAAESPYSGQHKREIKALSHEEIGDYLSGKGMGYAKAAELNHYPGPKHVLELAEPLKLTSEQVKQTQAVFDAMQNQAVALGKQLVEKEKELDRKFAAGQIDRESLDLLVSDIGALQAEIRYVHLQAHLEQKKLLSREQVDLYDQLRGYKKDQIHGHGSHHHH